MAIFTELGNLCGVKKTKDLDASVIMNVLKRTKKNNSNEQHTFAPIILGRRQFWEPGREHPCIKF